MVISERGDILTNLHVIRTTDRWEITFWDGSKSDAILVSMQPENDLAVIRPRRQPDDLKPATMASTQRSRDTFARIPAAAMAKYWASPSTITCDSMPL